MSYKLMTQVWSLALSPTEQQVLMAMADFATDDGDNCFPSHGRLAWKTGYSERTIARAINGFIEGGIVIVLRLGTNKAPPRYHLCLDVAEQKAPYRSEMEDSRGDHVSPLDSLGRSSVTPGGDPLSTWGDRGSPDPISNLSSNQPGKNGDALFSEMEIENAPELTAAETTRRWGECVKELGVEHRTMGDWLQGSELMATGGAQDGKPLYRLLVVNARSVDWLRHKGRRAICDSLRGVLGRAVAIEIVSELASVTP